MLIELKYINLMIYLKSHMQTTSELLIIMKAIRNILDMGKPELAKNFPYSNIQAQHPGCRAVHVGICVCKAIALWVRKYL